MLKLLLDIPLSHSLGMNLRMSALLCKYCSSFEERLSVVLLIESPNRIIYLCILFVEQLRTINKFPTFRIWEIIFAEESRSLFDNVVINVYIYFGRYLLKNIQYQLLKQKSIYLLILLQMLLYKIEVREKEALIFKLFILVKLIIPKFIRYFASIERTYSR